MTRPQFPRDVNLLDSYHELQALKVAHENLKEAMNIVSNLHSSRDMEKEALQGELQSLKARMERGVRVFISENGLLYRNLTDTKPNATLLLDKPEGA